MAGQLHFGLDTFGDVTVDADGNTLSHAQVIRNVVAEAELADRLGVDAFGIGEHHREDFAVSAPEVVLAAIASRTERILLGTAVTVLSSDFTEKLDLFAAVRQEQSFSWEGTVRAPLENADVYPKTESGSFPTWIGVGGTPESVIRAARYRFGLMLAIIGGDPERFVPYAELYRRGLDELGSPPLPIGVHSPGFIADTDDAARELLFPYFKPQRDRIGRERGWPPVTREQFESEVSHGAVFAGSPETVAAKIARTARALGLDRFDLKYSNGAMPHEHLMHTIELYGTEVIPRVRELLTD